MVERRTKTKTPKPAVVNDDGEITGLLEELEEALEIDEYELDDALQQQPQLFYEVSKQLQAYEWKRDLAKQQLTNIEYRIDSGIRRSARERDEKKTEKEITAIVRTHADYEKAAKHLAQLEQVVGSLVALREGYRQRGFSLGKLVDLYVANYFGASEPSGSRSVSKMREQSASTARSEMAKHRKKQR